MSTSIFINDNLHYNVRVSNFEQILELVQVESSSLGVVSTIVDIIWCLGSGLILKTFLDHKGNGMSIETSPTNNNIF